MSPNSSGSEVSNGFKLGCGIVFGILVAVVGIVVLLVSCGAFLTGVSEVREQAVEQQAEQAEDQEETASPTKVVVAEDKAVSEASDNWKITTGVSPIDDTETVICTLEADHPVESGYRTITPVLVIRWQEGKLESYINYNVFLASEEIEVTYRFGKREAQTRTFRVSSNSRSVFFRGDIGKMVQELDRTGSFTVRLTPYGENPITVSFTTTGMPRVMAAIRAAAL